MHVSIHEDNAGASISAETLPPQYMPQSKYYPIKIIWFHSEKVTREIKLVKIETVEQFGDMFIKALPRVIFESL